MTIGEKIYELRTSRNMSLREFAQLTGVTHTTIARLESPTLGPQKIFLDTIYSICKKLNYSFGTFLKETGFLPDYEVQEGIPENSAAEQQLIEQYRSLPEKLKRLVREQLDALTSPNELITKK